MAPRRGSVGVVLAGATPIEERSLTASTPPPHLSKSPRARPDAHGFDPGWAVCRVRDTLLGAGLLTLHITLFVLVTVGIVFWRLAQTPDTFSLPRILVLWAVLVLLHAAIVVAWAVVHGLGAPRRAPVYYRDIPENERTPSRPPAAQPATVPPPAAASDWGGPLASVTPFPTWRAASRSGRPEAAPFPTPDTHSPDAAAPANPHPAAPAVPDAKAPSLAEARSLLACDQPAWRRMFRRDSDTPSPAGNGNGNGSWLSPYPDAGSVTRTGAPSGQRFPTGEWMAGNGTATSASSAPPATNGGQPGTEERHPARPRSNGHRASDDELPSLAAMLRERNLLSLAEAPHKASGRPQPGERERFGAPATPPAPDDARNRPPANGRQIPQLREVARRQPPPR